MCFKTQPLSRGFVPLTVIEYVAVTLSKVQNQRVTNDHDF